jgi:histone H3/H4
MAETNKLKEDKKINLVVRTNIRKALKGKIDNVAEEVEEALNEKVHEILNVAVERAKANQRRTVQARDL